MEANLRERHVYKSLHNDLLTKQHQNCIYFVKYTDGDQLLL